MALVQTRRVADLLRVLWSDVTMKWLEVAFDNVKVKRHLWMY